MLFDRAHAFVLERVRRYESKTEQIASCYQTIRLRFTRTVSFSSRMAWTDQADFRNDRISLCHAPCVRDFPVFDGSYLRMLQRRNGNGFSVQGDEFDFERLSIAVHMYDSAHVSRGELVGRKIDCQHYAIVFFDDGHVRSCNG